MVEFTSDDLDYLSRFENVTKVMPKDYMILSETILFLVDQPLLGRAIGKQGSNIPKLRKIFNKKVVIIGDSPQMDLFIRNFFNNVTIEDIELRDVMGEQAILLTVDEKDRGLAIGKAGERIKAAGAAVKEGVKEVAEGGIKKVHESKAEHHKNKVTGQY